MQPWQVLHSICVWRWGAWTLILSRNIVTESSRVNAFVGTQLTTSVKPGSYWRPALGATGLFICPSMVVAFLASHTDMCMAGSAVVPSGWPCGILLYCGCPLEMLREHKDGQWLFSLVGEMEVRCLNWQKMLGTHQKMWSEADEKKYKPI